MRANYTVSLERIIKEFSLELLYTPEETDKLCVSTPEINRPGLEMAGYFEYFDAKRIQVIGKSEYSFLERFTPEKAESRIR